MKSSLENRGQLHGICKQAKDRRTIGMRVITSDSDVTKTLFSDLLYELYSNVREPPPMPGVVLVVVRRRDTRGTSRLLENCARGRVLRKGDVGLRGRR